MSEFYIVEEEVDDYLSENLLLEVKLKIKQLRKEGWDIKKLVACVYDLWQESIISERQEEILYNVADPEEKYNSPSSYWFDMDYENPLMEVLR